MDRTNIGVIIPTYKPDKTLRVLLRRLHKQTVLPKEILVINTDEESFDKRLLDGMEDVRLVHITREEFDHGATRNRGAELTHSDILVYMTMDAVPADPHLLEELTAAFEKPDTACAYARQLPAKGCDPIEYSSRLFNYGTEDLHKTKADLRQMGIKTYFCSNVCAAYRRDRFEQLGGFPEKTIFNEDMIFAAKAIRDGFAVEYCSRARVFHSHSYSGMQQLHRNFDMGVSQAEFPETFSGVPAESEGKKLVMTQMKWMAGHGQIAEIPRLIWLSACKYSGYRLGKGYEKLPGRLVRKLTGQAAYWD